jgi:uncharacterized protein YfaP (DUF2135 family)
MRKYSSNLAFVDLLFNLLVGFTCLFVIAFLLINPIAKRGTVDPPVKLMVEMTWDDESQVDIDLYVKGPGGRTVFYLTKENGYITLKRDDLGIRNDKYIINGQEVEVRRNYEITTLTALPDGDYVINIHYFHVRGGPEEVNVRVTNLERFGVVFDGKVTVNPRQEHTMVVFQVKDGVITNVRTDVKIKLRGGGTIDP